MKHKTVSAQAILSSIALASAFSCPCPSGAATNTSNKPVIGINMDLENGPPRQSSISVLYFEAIKKAGGIPVLIPPMSKEDINQLLPTLDGVMLIGGADYPPKLYNAEQEPKTHLMEKERSDFDIQLTEAALSTPDLPILGICAGCQALNIQPGGSLIQDIPSHQPNSKIMHASPQGWTKGFNKHVVEFSPESKLGQIYHAPLSVTTSHHQCIDKVGNGFHIVAKSADGLPEAIEKSGSTFVVGVQFHPERDYEANKALFAELIHVSEQRRLQREKLVDANLHATAK